MTIRALRFHGVGDLRLEHVRRPRPGPGEVVVEVEACGVCGSDLHVLDGRARTGRVPVTLGHEIAGVVAESSAPEWKEGDDVLVTVGLACGECDRCREARPNLCRQVAIIGLDRDGGLADAVLVPGSSLIRRPHQVPAEIAALAVDAGATAYHAVVRRGDVSTGTTVAVIGCGGLGLFALQIARAVGAERVVAVDVDVAARERASALGAEAAIDPGAVASVGRAVKEVVEGGVDVALEFVGAAATVDAAAKSLRPGGRAVAVGVGPDPVVTVPPVLWSTQEYELVGSFGSLAGDAERVLGWIADHTVVAPPRELASLDEAVSLIPALAAGERRPHGRLVVVP